MPPTGTCLVIAHVIHNPLVNVPEDQHTANDQGQIDEFLSVERARTEREHLFVGGHSCRGYFCSSVCLSLQRVFYGFLR